MAKITRYNGNLPAFASAAPGTERTIFGDTAQANDLTSQINADFLRGWGIVGPSDQPALEDFNGAMYTHGQLLAYLHQMGVAEWNVSQEYPAGGLANVSGLLYASLSNGNIGNPPATSPLAWVGLNSGALIGVQRFTASGTYTPTVGTRSIIVELAGGGGAGGGAATTTAGQVAAGGGGGGGGYSKSRLTTGFSPSVAVTVGLGGAPSPAGAVAGGSGGTSSFLSVSATGGTGGQGSVAAAPPLLTVGGAGGQGAGGTIVNPAGEFGGCSQALSAANAVSGAGGSVFFGGGAAPRGAGSPGVGLISGTIGAGGSGGLNLPSSAAVAGGGGGSGIVIVWEFA